MIQLRILKWGNYPALFKRALNTIRCFLMREVEGMVTETREQAIWLRLRLGVWRCQHLEKARKWFSPEPPERAQTRRFNFSPIKIISDFWPLQLWENTFLLLQVSELMLICHSNHRKMNSGIITRELVTCKHTHIHTWFSHHQVNKFISVLVLDIWVGPCKEETGRLCFANAAGGMLAVVWGHGRHLA